uniref:Uncharacterized protein n=1 Tax=Clandestinovirus TaxID=2831644 RepID=A0A8F8PKA3_9VIRU|nr:hypothetical protein KOM_12_535 [Clandestinovirus]
MSSESDYYDDNSDSYSEDLDYEMLEDLVLDKLDRDPTLKRLWEDVDKYIDMTGPNANERTSEAMHKVSLHLKQLNREAEQRHYASLL